MTSATKPLLTFTIPGPPIGKGRPRYVGAGHPPVTPAKTRLYETHIGWCGTAARHQHLTPGPDRVVRLWGMVRWYAMDIDIHFPPFTKTYRQPDDDNVLKAIKDGLEGVLWKNDKRVKGSVRDIYLDSPNPRVEVRVTAYEPKREVAKVLGKRER